MCSWFPGPALAGYPGMTALRSRGGTPLPRHRVADAAQAAVGHSDVALEDAFRVRTKAQIDKTDDVGTVFVSFDRKAIELIGASNGQTHLLVATTD
jgi:hypothetical protein